MGWQKGDVEALDHLLAAGFVNRGSNGGGATPESFKSGITELFAGLPDFMAVIEDVVIDTAASKAAIRWTGTGTHTGAMMGMQPTGKRMSFHGIDIIRIENERIVERWGESNAADVLGQ
jgi:predicted ester cyclase